MPKANELKRGEVVSYNGQLLLIKDIEVQSPSARGAATLYKMRFSDVRSGGKVEERFKGDEVLERVDLVRRTTTLSYVDGDDYVFMDAEDYTQFTFKKSDIEDELAFITEDTRDIMVLMVEDDLIGIELPQWVEMEIVETVPAMKAASASARTKPATLVTGLVITVPEYLEAGERIKIHTGERRFMGRAD